MKDTRTLDQSCPTPNRPTRRLIAGWQIQCHFVLAITACLPLSLSAQERSISASNAVRILSLERNDRTPSQSLSGEVKSAIKVELQEDGANESLVQDATKQPPVQDVQGLLLVTPNELLDRAVDFDRQTENHLESLQRRLHRLITEQLAQQLQAEPPTGAVEQPRPEAGSEAATEPAESPVGNSNGEPGKTGAGTGTPATQQPDTPADIARRSLKLLNHPVDQLALADNLLKTGEVQLALQMYLELPAGSYAEEDQKWIRFQIANCHRLLGNLDDSRKFYRETTNLGGDDFLISLARWWLNALDQQEALEKKTQEFIRINSAIEKELSHGK